MNLVQLQGFITVARTGSFTKAADELYLSQPALSLQIKALEESLGARLLERRGRQALLTEAGRVVYEKALHMLGLVEQIDQELAQLKGLATGKVRVGTSDTICLYVLPPHVQAFRARYPGIEIHLTNRPSHEVTPLLDEGKIDFGIVTLPHAQATPAPHLVAHSLLRRKDVAIFPPDHPLAHADEVTLRDLIAYPLLLLEGGSASRAHLDRILADARIGDRESAPQIVELGSIEVIKRYVEIGLGVSIVPRYAVEAELDAGRLVAAELPWLPEQTIGVVLRRGGYLSPASRAFLDLLTAGPQRD